MVEPRPPLIYYCSHDGDKWFELSQEEYDAIPMWTFAFVHCPIPWVIRVEVINENLYGPKDEA